MSSATRSLWVDNIPDHSGPKTQVGEAIYPLSGYGSTHWDDGGVIDLNSVFYKPNSVNSYLVWTRSIEMYLTDGLCGVNIGDYVSDIDNNPQGSMNVTLKLAPGDTVSDLQFKDIPTGWSVIFINFGTVIGEQSKPAITMHSTGRAVIENQGKIKGGGGHGGRGEQASSSNTMSSYRSYTSTSQGTINSPYSNTYRVDYDIRGAGGAGSSKGSSGSGYSDFDWSLYGGYQGSSKTGHFLNTGSVIMKVGKGGTTPVPTAGCIPVSGGTGGTTRFGSVYATGGKGGGWSWYHGCCRTESGGPTGHTARGIAWYQSGFNNTSYKGEGTGAGAGGTGYSGAGANGSISYRWRYTIPGGTGGEGGDGATRAGCDNDIVYKVQSKPGRAGARPTGGNRGGTGGPGGTWGEPGGYGYTVSGDQISSLSVGRTSGGASIINYYTYSKSGSFIGEKNVNYWGTPT